MKFFDAFAGIGGFRLGMERAGHECVGGAEWDKYARAIYEHRFGPSEHHYTDIRAVDPAGLPDFDVLCGGFPCQAFSIAGRRGGFSDTRGTMFFEIARIAKAKAPSFLFLENVKGLLSHDGGWTFWTILKTLDELGYDAAWALLNSRDFGVPQNRERIFIIGRSRAIRGREVFPLREGHQRNPQPHEPAQGKGEQLRSGDSQITGTVRPAARGAYSTVVSCLDATYAKGGGSRTMVEITEGAADAQRVYDADGISRTLKSTGGGLGASTGLYFIRKNMKGKDSDRKEEKYVDCGDAAATIMSKPDYNPKVVYKSGYGDDAQFKEGDVSPPLKASDSKCGDSQPMIVQTNQRRETVVKEESGAVHQSMSANQAPRVLVPGARIRRLTPLECERLQGFPDMWTSKGVFDVKGKKVVKDISDSQRYKVCGNAVTVNVIEEIARCL